MDRHEEISREQDLGDSHQETMRLIFKAIEHDRWLGIGLQPLKGCRFFEVDMGNAKIKVECEVDPGEPATRDHPGHRGSVTIINMLINGAMVPAEDWIDEEQLERWQERLWQQHQEASAS